MLLGIVARATVRDEAQRVPNCLVAEGLGTYRTVLEFRAAASQPAAAPSELTRVVKFRPVEHRLAASRSMERFLRLN